MSRLVEVVVSQGQQVDLLVTQRTPIDLVIIFGDTDYTGASAAFVARRTNNDYEYNPVVDAHEGAGITLGDGGEITILIPGDDMDIGAGSYFYSLIVDDEPVIAGMLVVDPNMT